MLEKLTSLQDLQTAIQTILVKDYGDFKRKSVLYINRALELESLSSAARRSLQEMSAQIQFKPNFDIEKTRYELLQKIKSIR